MDEEEYNHQQSMMAKEDAKQEFLDGKAAEEQAQIQQAIDESKHIDELPQDIKEKILALSPGFNDKFHELKEQYKHLHPEWDDGYAFSPDTVTGLLAQDGDSEICVVEGDEYDSSWDWDTIEGLHNHKIISDDQFTLFLKYHDAIEEAKAFLSKNNELFDEYQNDIEKILVGTEYYLEVDEVFYIYTKDSTIEDDSKQVWSFIAGTEE
jgi:hypothetical protein